MYSTQFPSRVLKQLLCCSLLLATAAFPARAQDTAPKKADQYCQLVVLGNSFFENVIRLEYGENRRKGAVNDPELSESAGAVARLGSTSAALNYLSARGWECLGFATIPARTNSAGLVDGEIGYLLRRRAQ